MYKVDKRDVDGFPLLDAANPVAFQEVGQARVEQVAVNAEFVVSADSRGCVRAWSASSRALLSTAAPECGRAGLALREGDLAVADPTGQVTVLALGGGQPAVSWRPPCQCGHFNRLVRVRWSRSLLWTCCAAGHLRGCSRDGAVVSFADIVQRSSVVDFALDGENFAVLIWDKFEKTIIRRGVLKDAVPELPVFAHFAGLFESGEHADVILRMCGVEIKAHRAILVARAAFFARQAAFEELQEKSPIPVMSLECEGVDADDFRAVIRYTGDTGPVPSGAAAISRFIFANFLCCDDVATDYEKAAIALLTPELIIPVLASCSAECDLAKAALDMFDTHSVVVASLHKGFVGVPETVKSELLTRSCGRDLRPLQNEREDQRQSSSSGSGDEGEGDSSDGSDG